MDQFNGSVLSFPIITKSHEPVHIPLAAKPGHLPLGVVAMGLLHG